jgi:branched-chain amino acid transport system substrate-binding protein
MRSPETTQDGALPARMWFEAGNVLTTFGAPFYVSSAFEGRRFDENSINNQLLRQRSHARERMMGPKRSLWLLVGLGVCVCQLLTGPVTAVAKPIKIGIVDTYSGPPSLYTNDVRDAFTLIMEKINGSGGILGNKVEIVTRDDGNKVDVGLSQAKELIMKEQVDILVGTNNSALSLAISDLCRKEKVPCLVTLGKSDSITGANGHRYVFSVNENTAMIGKAAAVALAKRPYVK